MNVLATDHRDIPYPYGRLSATSRTIIALRRHIRLSKPETCRIIGLRHRELAELWRELQEDEEALHVIRTGLPAMFGEMLRPGQRVRCPFCKCWITWVPCIRCCAHHVVFADRNDVARDREPEVEPALPEPTKFLPGTPEKKELMRHRFELGQAVFHHLDARYPD